MKKLSHTPWKMLSTTPIYGNKWLSLYHTSKSVMDETAYLFVGEHLTPAEASPDATEFIEVQPLPFATALHMVLSGEIVDSMTIVAILHTAHRRLSV